MRARDAIAAGAALLVLAAAGVCGARLHSGSYVMNFPGSECRELHTIAGSGGHGRFNEYGQGYEGIDPDHWMQVFCPLWYVEQLDIGRHRWDWTPGPGMTVHVRVDVIDNHESLDTTCWLHTSDSLDWDGDHYADWDASEGQSTYGTGLTNLGLWAGASSWASGNQFERRDGFLALYCEVPPIEAGHQAKPTRIAGYRLTVTREQYDAN
jgi:hypothetical protein